jgi:SET domain-containing protein
VHLRCSVDESAIDGRGVFATAPIAAHAMIAP